MPTTQTRAKTSLLRRGITLLLGVLVFGGLLYLGGWEALEKLARPDPLWLAAGMGGAALSLFCFTSRWGTIANSIAGRRVASFASYYFYGASSMAVSLFLPQTASVAVVRTAALSRLGVSPQKSIASVLLDKLFDALFMLIFALPALLLVFSIATLSGTIAVSLLGFGVLSLLIARGYARWLRLIQRLILLAVALLRRIPVLKRFGQIKAVERLEHLEEWGALRPDVFWRAYWITAAGQLLLALRVWMFAQAVGIETISPLATFVGVALAQAGALVAITPGALGTAEAGWYLALAAAGAPGDDIAVFLIAVRVYQTVGVAVNWLLAYVLHMRG